MKMGIRLQETGDLTVLWWDQPVSPELYRALMKFMKDHLHTLTGKVAVLKLLKPGEGIPNFGEKTGEQDYVLIMDKIIDEYLYPTKKEN